MKHAISSVLSVTLLAVAGCSTPPVITQAECDQIQMGQSLQEVQAIVGDPGKEISRNEIPGVPEASGFSQQWLNSDGSGGMMIFQGEKLSNKTCYGLK